MVIFNWVIYLTEFFQHIVCCSCISFHLMLAVVTAPRFLFKDQVLYCLQNTLSSWTPNASKLFLQNLDTAPNIFYSWLRWHRILWKRKPFCLKLALQAGLWFSRCSIPTWLQDVFFLAPLSRCLRVTTPSDSRLSLAKDHPIFRQPLSLSNTIVLTIMHFWDFWMVWASFCKQVPFSASPSPVLMWQTPDIPPVRVHYFLSQKDDTDSEENANPTGTCDFRACRNILDLLLRVSCLMVTMLLSSMIRKWYRIPAFLQGQKNILWWNGNLKWVTWDREHLCNIKKNGSTSQMHFWHEACVFSSLLPVQK